MEKAPLVIGNAAEVNDTFDVDQTSLTERRVWT